MFLSEWPAKLSGTFRMFGENSHNLFLVKTAILVCARVTLYILFVYIGAENEAINNLTQPYASIK